MRRMYRLEMRRALRCPTFMVSLAVGTALSVVAAGESIWRYFDWHARRDPYLDTSFLNQYALNAYTQWLPDAVMLQVTSALFFFIAPLLIGLAYGWSWRHDVSTGYGASVLVRASRGRWDRAKGLAAFVSGGLVVTVPLLANFAIVFCAVPAQTPNIVDGMWNGVLCEEFLSEMFYTNPALYVLVRFVMDFLLAGLWATTVLSLSRFIRNKVAVVVLPYIGMLVVKYVSQNVEALFYQETGLRYGALTMIDLLRVRGDYEGYTWLGVLLCSVSMLVVSVLVPRFTRDGDVL